MIVAKQDFFYIAAAFYPCLIFKKNIPKYSNCRMSKRLKEGEMQFAHAVRIALFPLCSRGEEIKTVPQ